MQSTMISRRKFIQYSGVVSAGAVLSGFSIIGCGSGRKVLMYVGTYTSGESLGIYRYRFDTDTGGLEFAGETPDVVNPSYLSISPDRKHLYSVNQISDYQGNESGAVSSFNIDRESGDLTFTSQQSSQGSSPCYVTVDKSGKWVLGANYQGGNVFVLPVQEDGSLGPATDVRHHRGTGPKTQRQEAPHAHCILVDKDNRYALAADLGADKVMVYHLDTDNGLLIPNDPPFMQTAPGAGPRHITFHPDGHQVFVINELNNTIISCAYDRDRGRLSQVQTVSTLPDDFMGTSSAADIHVSHDGRYLYGSNRGHNSIVVYAIDNSNGELSYLEHQGQDVDTPRNFVIDPTDRFLLVANQRSDSIVVFRRDSETGKLTPTGNITDIPEPVCLKFL